MTLPADPTGDVAYLSGLSLTDIQRILHEDNDTMTLTQLTLEYARLHAELNALARTHGSTMEQLLVISRQMTPVERAIRLQEGRR